MSALAGSNAPPVVVIGAGIIGAAIAFDLIRRGESVVLIDKDPPGLGASWGNLASIAVSEFMPSSRPAIWARIPGWLLDPEGPIRFRPSYLPALAPWLWRFVAAGRPSRVRALSEAGAALCARVHEDLVPFLAAAELSDMLSAEGCLCLYASESEFVQDRDHVALLERFDIAHETIGNKAIHDLEPAIAPEISRAILLPNNRSIRDPYRLVVMLTERVAAMGGHVRSGEVVGFERSDGRLTTIRLGDGSAVPATRAVICSGVHSGRLAALLQESIPMESERGYHSHLLTPNVSLRHSLLYPAQAFMVTPTSGGIRIGGTVEMAGLDAPADYRRAKIVAKRARRLLPSLRTTGATEWMGHRPALPDTVPVIGPSATTHGVFYATGHGHLGLTLSATTARLIADLVTARTPPLDLKPFRVDRF